MLRRGMKILELQLRAFGAFSDFRLDLSEGSEGLHLIYGPNEAGKSTARRALTNLFYGIPHLSADDFRHGRQDLRIAARVRRADRSELAFTRRKGTRNTLLDFAGAEPLAPDALDLCLGGVEKSVFETLFCLDHDELVKGSQSILQGSGAVGEALFSAGLGGANLRACLRELDAEAETLFKRQGQNQRINAHLKSFRAARDRIRASALSGSAWAELDRQLSDARGRRAELTARRDACRTERERLERLGRALPSLAKRALLLGKIEALGPLPPLPDSFPRDRLAAAAELKAAASDAEKATTELAEIAQRLTAVAAREDVLGAAGAISSLQQGVGAFREDQAALPGGRGELIQLQAAAASALAELRPGVSLEEAGALRLSVLQRESIRRLAITHAAMHAAEAAARETLEKAETYLAQRRLTLREMPPLPDATALAAAVRRVQKRGDLDRAAALARREAAEAEAAAKALCALPPPWQGDLPADRAALEALAGLPMPLETSLSRFETDFASAAHRVAQSNEEALRYEHQLADAQRALEALQRGVQLPSVADLENARDWRDYGWELVSAAWAAGRRDLAEDPGAFVSPGQTLEEAYAAAVVTADDCVDRLRREASRVAQCAALQASGDNIRRRVAEVAASRAANLAAADDLRERWMELWRPCGFEPLSPAEMRAWMGRHEKLRVAVAALTRAEGQAAAAEEAAEASRAELAACLPAPGPPAGETLDALLDRAQLHLGEVSAQAARRAHLAHEIEIIETSTRPAAEKKRREAREGLETWAQEWALALKSLPLEREITPAEAEGVLSRIEGLFDALARAEAHRHEIELRALRVDAFICEVNGLTGRLEDAARWQALSPEAAAEQLRHLLRQHELARAEQETHDARQIAVAAALELARAREAAARATLDGFCRVAGCERPEQLEAVESRWRQGSALRRSLAELEEQLLDLSAGQSLESLEVETRTLDADALPGRLDTLRAEIKTLDGQIESAVAEAARAEQTLARYDGPGDAAAAAEDAQSLLASLRDRAMEYSRLRLAAAVLRREMERFRTENQSPLVRRAGQLFAELTGGSFAGLCVDFDGTDRAVLRGVRPGSGAAGTTVGVDGMSEGTRDQLYLALRLASLERALDAQEPLPLILDDILVNFDDARARAVLRVLRDFSERAQVLLFVHHEHLLALAQEALPGPGLYVHRLAPGAT